MTTTYVKHMSKIDQSEALYKRRCIGCAKYFCVYKGTQSQLVCDECRVLGKAATRIYNEEDIEMYK